MVVKTTKRLVLTPCYSRRFKLLVAPVACFYLLITVLVTLCLTHPPDGHSHSQADGHFHFICVWVQKGISSHAPAAKLTLPLAEAALFVLLSLPWLLPLIQVVQLTGRSPPTSPAIP
jgi:hypothetical protein